MSKSPFLVLAGLVVSFSLFAVFAASADPGDRLPDLVMQKPTDVKQETLADGRTVLRYTATIANQGIGNLELDANLDAAGWHVAQRIFACDTWPIYLCQQYRDVPLPAAQVVWGGDGHNHFHILNVETGELADASGRTIATTEKHNFCFLDAETIKTGGRAGMSPNYLGSGVCAFNNPNATSFFTGISAGWTDIYGSILPDQFIDVTGLQKGAYRFTVGVNPALGIVESDTSNNSTSVTVRIR